VRRYSNHLLILLALVFTLPIFPPETRGESMAGCALLLVLLAAVPGKGRVPSSGSSLLCVGLVVACPLVLASSAPGASVTPLAVLFLAAATAVHVSTIPRDIRNHESIAWVVSAAGTFSALYAIHDRLWGLERKVAEVLAAGPVPDREVILARLQGGRAFEPFATPAALGGFLGIAMAVTVGLAWKRSGRTAWAAWAMVLLQAGGMLAASSATASAALLGAVLVAWLRLRGRRKWMLVAAVVLVVMVAGVVTLRGKEILSFNDPGNPIRLRAGNFRIAAEIAADHPWIGAGPGNYGELYPSYRRPGDNESQHAHNLPLEWSAEFGILPGTVLSILFMVVFLRPLFRAGANDPPWRVGMAVALASFALHNLGDFTALFPSLLWLAAVLRGVMASDNPPERSAEGLPLRRISAALAMAGMVLAAAIAAGSGLSWNSRKAAEFATAAGEGDEAVRLASRAVLLAPWDVDSRLVYAGTLIRNLPSGTGAATALQPVLDEVEAAVRLSPVRPSARAWRAMIRERTGDAAGAYADYAHASRLYPLWNEYRENADRVAAALARKRTGGEM